MSDELSNATRIAALEAEVVRLTAELQGEREDLANAQTWIGGQDTFSDFHNAGEMRWALVQEREKSASLSSSIIAACTGSGCLNAHELRAALDRERELANRLDNDRAHMTLRFTEEATAHVNTLKELGRERERCFVLEREVLKWRYAEYISRAIENAAYLDTERHELNAARTETDTSHALDAAKFVGGG